MVHQLSLAPSNATIRLGNVALHDATDLNLARHPKSAEPQSAVLNQTFRKMGTPYECRQALIH